VAWVTLDEGDDDAVVLWSHVVEALGRVCVGLPHETLAGMVASSPLLEVVIPRLSPSIRPATEGQLRKDDR
jgi:LuxR family maltose regulon positive regulatory protein